MRLTLTLLLLEPPSFIAQQSSLVSLLLQYVGHMHTERFLERAAYTFCLGYPHTCLAPQAIFLFLNLDKFYAFYSLILSLLTSSLFPVQVSCNSDTSVTDVPMPSNLPVPGHTSPTSLCQKASPASHTAGEQGWEMNGLAPLV